MCHDPQNGATSVSHVTNLHLSQPARTYGKHSLSPEPDSTNPSSLHPGNQDLLALRGPPPPRQSHPVSASVSLALIQNPSGRVPTTGETLHSPDPRLIFL